MDTLLIVLLVTLIILILIFMGVLIFLGLRLFKLMSVKHKSEEPPYSSEAISMIKEAKEQASNDHLGQKCVDHPELNAKGTCSLSDQAFCELCLTKEKDIKIARKFLHLLLDHEWLQLHFINNEEVGGDKLNELYRVKKEIWKGQDIPLITQKQYKINIENDQVEAYTMVMGRKSDLAELENVLVFLQ